MKAKQPITHIPHPGGNGSLCRPLWNIVGRKPLVYAPVGATCRKCLVCTPL